MPSGIALVDCDCFFVSCEQADNPQLRGKPVCVVTAGNGCVVSRSKEAKAVGVKMGQPLFMAKRDFPQVIYVPVRHERYKFYSRRVMDCLRTFSPDVEVCSVDEAYIDLSGLDKLYHKSYMNLAYAIRRKVWEDCRIPVSIGVGTSKTLAKLASDKAKKTDGVCVVAPQEIQDVLAQTPLEDVCGFGRQHTIKMKMNGVFTCAEFVQKTDSWVRQNLGIVGLNLKYELLGYKVSKVSAVAERPKSVQDTSALTGFTTDKDILRASLKYHVHCASRKLRQENCYCRTVGVLLRTKDFAVMVDYVKLTQPTNGERDIFEAAVKLLEKLYRPKILYRSSGVILEHLIGADEFQPSLFTEPAYHDDKVSRVLDALELKFGKDVVKNGLF